MTGEIGEGGYGEGGGRGCFLHDRNIWLVLGPHWALREHKSQTQTHSEAATQT